MSRTPQWQTTAKAGVSGDRTRAPLQTHPRWRWTLKSGVLQSAYNDLQAIQNLYTAMYGRLDWFLWKDPEGATISDPTQQINYKGDYYWPVAFTTDGMDFDRFAYQLWECGTCEFEQVSLPQFVYAGAQAPNGFSTSPASLHVLSSHIPGATYSGAAWFSNGIVSQLPGGEPTSWLLRDNSSWTLRSDTASVNLATALTMLIEFSIAGSLLGSTTPPDEFRIYDITLNVTYEDGTIGTLRPTVATVVADPQNQGFVTNAANAIDGNTGTYASITRSSFSPGFFTSPVLQLSQFA